MMWDWHNAPMTILETAVSCAVIVVTAFLLFAIAVEVGTGMPARTAVTKCGYIKILMEQCHVERLR